MSRVVVGVDGSASSLFALETAFDEAAMREADLEVVAVVPTTSFASMYGYVPAQETGPHMEAAREKTQAAVDQLVAGRDGKAPRKVTVRVRSGVPAEELMRVCRGAALLVVGSRGEGGFHRLILGSVSSALVHHATCPVLVTPARPEQIVVAEKAQPAGALA